MLCKQRMEGKWKKYEKEKINRLIETFKQYIEENI